MKHFRELCILEKNYPHFPGELNNFQALAMKSSPCCICPVFPKIYLENFQREKKMSLPVQNQENMTIS